MEIMQMVLEKLGLQEEEEFQINQKEDVFYYQFHQNYLLVNVSDETNNMKALWSIEEGNVLNKLISGVYTVKKLTFKPSLLETYYYSDITSANYCGKAKWTDSYNDRVRLALGLVYRREREATERTEELADMIQRNQKGE